jgi:hypothetical protein
MAKTVASRARHRRQRRKERQRAEVRLVVHALLEDQRPRKWKWDPAVSDRIVITESSELLGVPAHTWVMGQHLASK